MLQRVAKERNSCTPEIYRSSYVAHRRMRADEKRHEQKMEGEEDDNESQRVSQPARKEGRDSATCHDIVLAVLQLSVQLEYIL